ncbi:hypothetical protein C8F04DRAFT_1037443 [Mycena alexandri]|uniref:Uncharacterized protein n=1 Tax=Mycena alexandri TaxID=1745969 RepID=A0AAD6SYB6_9AGAR|nr:hypothetical protein C8F04DRAFT_1037443 [Mycena alexandri]
MNEPSHIEFEAPPAAAMASAEKRHYSIDLSLELERQLDMESLPPTPAPINPPQEQHQHQRTPSNLMQMPDKMPDIDPHVLAHIISQLRHQLADMTRERDDVLALLSTAHTKEAELEDALQHITDKAMGLDEALSDARRKNRDDEEAISMLRTKVEESRRGLMRLQAESRRAPAALDTGRANAPSAFMGPPSSKRASFTPLTGTFAANSFVGRPNGHRRISSVSDSNVALTVPDLAGSPPEHSLSIAPSKNNNRRMSGFFGRNGSPPQEIPQFLPSSSPDELEKLRKELRATQDALTETRNELTEANEAREASETCVGALREYIAENNIGSEMKLPPLPAATTGEETDPNAPKKSWGFKLWKVDTAVKTAPSPPSAASGSNATASPSIPPTALPAVVNPNAPAPAAPLARRLTGFFSSRGSISSMASVTPSLAPLQTDPRRMHARDSVYSLSDASSLAEPISPTSQFGAGAEVRVRDVNGSPDLAGTSPDAVHDVKEAPQQDVTDDALSLRSVAV